MYSLINWHKCLEEPAGLIFRVGNLKLEAVGACVLSYMGSWSRIL